MHNFYLNARLSGILKEKRRKIVRMAQRRLVAKKSSRPPVILAAMVVSWIKQKGPANTSQLQDGLDITGASLRPVLAMLVSDGILRACEYRAATGGFVGTRYNLEEPRDA